MAKNRIKGITIEIDGDVSGLQRALNKVDSSLKNTQTALKDVNKLLKLDPKNTELLTQKQGLLKDAINTTEQRLKELNNAYGNLKAESPEELVEKQNALKREIIETEQNLKSLKDQYKDFGSVAKQQLKAVSDQLKNTGEKLQSTGKDLTLKLTAPIVALGTIGVNYNAQIEQYQTMFTTLTGSAEEADRIISQLQSDAQKSPFDSASLIQANQYLISAGVSADEARNDILNLGNAIAATGGGSAELERMAQNLQQIKNVGKATSQDIKQFANAGINIYGLLAEATGKNVEEIKEMDVSYEVLSEALAKASQEGGKYAGAMEAQGQTLNGSLSATKEAIQMLLGEITQSAMPIIVEILGKVRDVITWISNLDAGTKQMILTVAAVIAAIGPVLAIIGSIVTGIGGLISAIGFLASPMGVIILAVTEIGAALYSLYTNMDVVKAKVAEVVERVRTAFQTIADFVISKVDAIISKLGAIKDAISNAFSFDGILGRVSGFFSSIGSMFGSFGMSSGGFNGMSSGGMMSLSINNSFTINNADMNEAMARNFANIITEQINENLGRMI